MSLEPFSERYLLSRPFFERQGVRLFIFFFLAGSYFFFLFSSAGYIYIYMGVEESNVDDG